jgi:outer membrane protein
MVQNRTNLQYYSLSKLLCRIALVVMVAPAAAQKADDNMVSVGWVHTMPFSSAKPLRTDLRPSPLYSTLGVPPSFTSDGTSAHVADFDTAALAYTHFFTDQFAARVDVGVPAHAHLNGQGVVRVPGTIPPPFVVQPIDLGSPNNNPLASAREWNPALLFLYCFGQKSWLVHPNIGLGATYTWFSDVGLNQNFQNQVNSQLGPVLATAAGKPGPTHMNATVSRSWSPIFNFSLKYDIDRHWGLTTSLSYLLQHENARINVFASDDTLLATSGTRVTVNPLITILFINYTF